MQIRKKGFIHQNNEHNLDIDFLFDKVYNLKLLNIPIN